ncbi:hypothetical protein FHS43_005070 [Streptosporangium becharense]|uniref:Uncharacterized protein n=1 Tax=Streptosporangium becharense TaxID=1816182 RepID=A0A7W9MEC6_9ACTN|nr:hypothetical protein [Streptosporangium becharense]MBB2913761.1 hypothetical protein [Streptosporangium becharense]MBB5817842.1 hypothetical protein [Streptosporangium becharense]
MVPTLIGRIQTRLFLLATVGVIITLLLMPILPGLSGSLGDLYVNGLLILVAVGVLGIGWELIYHFLMQFRWEKDWPTSFGLLTFIPEGLLLYFLLRSGAVDFIDPVPLAAFWTHFTVVWVCMWLVANGPMRVPFIRWRFRGGRVL